MAWEATENSASGMLAQWPAANTHTDPRTAVLLPLGNLATTQLETGLTSAGYTPTRVTTYLTVAHPAPPSALAAWRAGRIDAVILTSGSIVEQFVAQFGHPSPGPGPPRGMRIAPFLLPSESPPVVQRSVIRCPLMRLPARQALQVLLTRSLMRGLPAHSHNRKEHCEGPTTPLTDQRRHARLDPGNSPSPS